MSQRVVIFAGAGASKAVNAKKFPTTVEFFERLPDGIKSQPLFQLVVQSIQATQEIDIIDIEVLLWELQIVRRFLNSVVKRDSVLSKLLIDHNLLNNVVHAGGVGSLHAGSQQLLPVIDRLVSEINRVVFQLYGYEPEDSELSSNWVPLLDVVRDSGACLDVFTTNYDVNVESALASSYQHVRPESYLGLRGKHHKMLDLTRWKIDAPSSEVLLTKLHGSIDWKLDNNSIYVGDPVFTGDHRKQAIVYPGFKGQSESPFFSVFHAHLERCLTDADAIIFIGFAFRDEHINNIIQRSMERRNRVLVINPDKEVEFPQQRATVRTERAFFDEKSVSAAKSFLAEVLAKKRGPAVRLI